MLRSKLRNKYLLKNLEKQGYYTKNLDNIMLLTQRGFVKPVFGNNVKTFSTPLSL